MSNDDKIIGNARNAINKHYFIEDEGRDKKHKSHDCWSVSQIYIVSGNSSLLCFLVSGFYLLFYLVLLSVLIF